MDPQPTPVTEDTTAPHPLQEPRRLRVVCLADPAGKHLGIEVPDGDVLVVAGSVTSTGYAYEARDFGRWVSSLPHPRKIVVPGEKDLALHQDPVGVRDLLGGCGVEGPAELAGLRVWGLSHARCSEDGACGQPSEVAVAKLGSGAWDILVSAGPPRGVLDQVGDRSVGCSFVAEVVELLRPRLHVFGGDGCSRGARFVDGHLFVCASGAEPLVLTLQE